MSFERQLRTREEIHERIRQIKTAWREMGEKAPEVQPTMEDNLAGQLEALYWVLGHSLESAVDSASVAMGGDPIDWS